MTSSTWATASSGADPSVSPPSSTSAFDPTPSPSTTVSRTPRSPDAASAESRSTMLTPSLERLDEDVDLAAAGEADAPCQVVLDAVAQQLRLAGAEHLLGVLEHVALDTATGDGPAHLPRLGDRETCPDGPWRRAPCRNDGCDDDPFAVLLP